MWGYCVWFENKFMETLKMDPANIYQLSVTRLNIEILDLKVSSNTTFAFDCFNFFRFRECKVRTLPVWWQFSVIESSLKDNSCELNISDCDNTGNKSFPYSSVKSVESVCVCLWAVVLEDGQSSSLPGLKAPTYTTGLPWLSPAISNIYRKTSDKFEIENRFVGF